MEVLFIQGGGEGAHAEDEALVDSLRAALPTGIDIHYPTMPDEDAPDLARWKKAIAAQLTRLTGRIILIGHSLGGSILLRYLADEEVPTSIDALVLLAAPSWDEHDWDFPDLQLPRGLAQKLEPIPRILLFHGRADEIVPFAHLALHATRLPTASVHPLDGVGHQFGDDLAPVAEALQPHLR